MDTVDTFKWLAIIVGGILIITAIITIPLGIFKFIGNLISNIIKNLFRR